MKLSVVFLTLTASALAVPLSLLPDFPKPDLVDGPPKCLAIGKSCSVSGGTSCCSGFCKKDANTKLGRCGVDAPDVPKPDPIMQILPVGPIAPKPDPVKPGFPAIESGGPARPELHWMDKPDALAGPQAQTGCGEKGCGK